MRLKGRQVQFLLVVFVGWVSGRWLATQSAERAQGGVQTTAHSGEGQAMPKARPYRPAAKLGGGEPHALKAPVRPIVSPSTAMSGVATTSVLAGRLDRVPDLDWSPGAPAGRESDVVPPSADALASRWSVSAYLFFRPGEGRPSLAGGGALGGSQAAARVTYRLKSSAETRTAVAVRAYAPLRGNGAEAAVGLDWHPLADVPLRLSGERRIALDRAGRNAWSAYAAGGFYSEPATDLVVDGYGQAGVVGARRRDLFADGGVRVGRRLLLGRTALVAGAGVWGAAQPGVARIDGGPRLAVTVPVEQHSIGIAAEGRFRLAGDAQPGSGAALTVSVDF
jgi:hypothetical protein